MDTSKIEKQSTEQYIESLMDSLVNAPDSASEQQLMVKIWEFSNPEIHEDIYSLSLSVVDEKGRRVANNLSSAIGRVKATITVGKEEKNWRKSITFTPKDKDNLYYMMLE